MAIKPSDIYDENIVAYLEKDEEPELDALMLAESQDYESTRAPPITAANAPASAAPKTTRPAPPNSLRFATPKTSWGMRKLCSNICNLFYS